MKHCPYCAEEIQDEAIKCKHCGSWLSPGTEPPAEAGPPQGIPVSGRLVRSSSDKMLAGLCGGVARYLGIDSTLLRIIVVVVSLLTAVVPGLIVYLILALIVPSEDSGLV